jgi:hypothetical protein
MKLTAQDVIAYRKAGRKEELLKAINRHEAINPMRRFQEVKGLKGKDKKKFRKALREQASAKVALVDKQTSGGLVNDRTSTSRTDA